MNGNILMLPVGGTSSVPSGHLPQGGRQLAVREIDDQDLYVNFVNRHPRHVQRRKDRKDAMKRKVRKAREDRDQQMRDLAMVSQFSAFGVLVTLGLML